MTVKMTSVVYSLPFLDRLPVEDIPTNSEVELGEPYSSEEESEGEGGNVVRVYVTKTKKIEPTFNVNFLRDDKIHKTASAKFHKMNPQRTESFSPAAFEKSIIEALDSGTKNRFYKKLKELGSQRQAALKKSWKEIANILNTKFSINMTPECYKKYHKYLIERDQALAAKITPDISNNIINMLASGAYIMINEKREYDGINYEKIANKVNVHKFVIKKFILQDDTTNATILYFRNIENYLLAIKQNRLKYS